MKKLTVHFIVLILASVGIGATQIPASDLTDANFFLKYFYQNRSEKNLTAVTLEEAIEVPRWYINYCKKRRITQNCEQPTLNQTEFNALLDLFEEAKYNSYKGGAIMEALKVARRHPGTGFTVLLDAVDHFSKEFEFHKMTLIREEKQMWKTLSKEMPSVDVHRVKLKDVEYEFHYRSDGDNHAVDVRTVSGETIFTDGPRIIDYANQPALRQLSTSMTSTWTHPDHRGAGIYQYALNFYMKKLNLNQVTLYSENEETLDFIYRFKQLIYQNSERAKLLRLPGLVEYLESQNIPIDKFSSGDGRYLKIAERALGYLSLQGRTRLNQGLSFELSDSDHAYIFSRKISKAHAAHIKSSMKSFEATIEAALSDPSQSEIVRILPVTYLLKFKPKQKEAPNSCIIALQKSA